MPIWMVLGCVFVSMLQCWLLQFYCPPGTDYWMRTYLYSHAWIISRKRNNILFFTPLDWGHWIRWHLTGKNDITSFGYDDVMGSISDNWFCKVCRRWDTLRFFLTLELLIIISIIIIIKNSNNLRKKNILKQISATRCLFHTNYCIYCSHWCCILVRLVNYFNVWDWTLMSC